MAVAGRKWLARIAAAIRGVLDEATQREIVTAVAVAAPPDLVWDVLTDFAAYPSWNPFLRTVTGEVRVGKRLRVVAVPGRGPGIRFRALVMAARPGAELRWRGVFLWSWLFYGYHYFVLEELPGTVIDSLSPPGVAAPTPNPPSVLLRHGEVLGGLLSLVVGRFLASRMRSGFESMNRALKERAEGAVLSRDTSTG